MKPDTSKQSAHTKTARAFIEKIVVNAGIGRTSQTAQFEEKVLPQITRDLASITGQKPQLRPAKKSIAGFKMREGQIVGTRITLRGKKAVDFFERLITIVIPRVRDFTGIDLHTVDAHGVLNLGFKEQYVFPEVDPEESIMTFSLGINIVPREKKRHAALEAYRAHGVPLKK